jgi:hypothetical protein
MIIAVAVVGIVQVAIDEVIGVIAMGNCLMTALWTMPVAGFVPGTSVLRSASSRITCTDIQTMFIHVITVR